MLIRFNTRCIFALRRPLFSLAPTQARRRHFSHVSIVDSINSALDSKNVGLALDLSQELAKSSAIPSETFTIIYEQLLEMRDPMLVHLFFKLIPYTDKATLRSNVYRVFKLYLSMGDTESALAWLRSLQLTNKGSMEVPYDLLEQLLLSAKWHRDVEIAWQCLHVILDVHKSVYARSWGLFLSLVLDCQNYEALKWFHKKAGIPGYIVMDDHSYLAMAEIAAKHGDLLICQWAMLRMIRRQRVMNMKNAGDTLRAFVLLIEAAAKHGDENTNGSIKSACRYLLRLRDAAANVRVSDLRQFVEALSDYEAREYALGVYRTMCQDLKADESVKTLLYNLILCWYIDQWQFKAAQTHYREAIISNVHFNDDSKVLLVRLAAHLLDIKLLEQFIAGTESPRVLRTAYKYALDMDQYELAESIKENLQAALRVQNLKEEIDELYTAREPVYAVDNDMDKCRLD